MQLYADQVWRNDRDPATGLFHFAGSPETQTLEQSAMVQIYALAAWPESQYRLLA